MGSIYRMALLEEVDQATCHRDATELHRALLCNPPSIHPQSTLNLPIIHLDRAWVEYGFLKRTHNLPIFYSCGHWWLWWVDYGVDYEVDYRMFLVCKIETFLIWLLTIVFVKFMIFGYMDFPPKTIIYPK